MPLTHPIPPCFASDSRCLILGSFPSVKSREQGFFYGHPQNRFWRVLAAVYGQAVPLTIPEKRTLLQACRVALWDVIASCDIVGSSDSSIRNAVPNDVRPLLQGSTITRIFTNGKAADALYRKHMQENLGLKAVCLPSTSPANAAFSLDRLTQEWRAALLNPSEVK